MDPTLTRQYMDEGKLPNLKKLSEEGTFSKLETTQPSESPVAWSSFATGVNPGKHNIFDFLVRDFDTYLPDLGMVKREPPEFLWGMIPTKRPKAISTRGGTSFWVHAGNDGRQERRPHRARDLPPGGGPPRRPALRPAPARHPRHRGHLLLLGHRPLVVRGRATRRWAAT